MYPPLFDQYLSFLREVLTPKRLQHSLGVMQVMGELADVYGLDQEKSLTAGLLHDAGKDLSKEQYEQIMKDAGIEIQYPCDLDYVHYLHGPVSSYFVWKQLGILDQLVLDAITMHTYYGHGDNFGSPFVWCLRFSDILEPGRNWQSVQLLREGVDRLRKTIYSGRIQEAAFLQTGWLIRWFEEVGKPVHPNMRRVFEELSTQLNLDESFL